MRWITLSVVLVAGFASQLPAQVSVRAQMADDALLVFESVPVTITLRNYSGRTIELEDRADEPWLKITVTGEGNTPVAATGRVSAGARVLLPPGESLAHTVDLLPLFAMRARGTYRVQISAGGAMTAPLAFSLTEGRELWKQTVGLPGSTSALEEYRTYRILSRQSGRQEFIFASVHAEPGNRDYCLVRLGSKLPTGNPSAMLDNAGDLHVLFQNAPRSFGYVHVDSEAKVVKLAAFSDFMSSPQLTKQGGQVVVAGGEQTYPKPERILTDSELNPPPPPPPPPPPKKKWWWPFGPKHVPGEG